MATVQIRTGRVRLAIGALMVFGLVCVVLPLAGKKGHSSSALRVTPGKLGGMMELAEEVSEEDKNVPTGKKKAISSKTAVGRKTEDTVENEAWPCEVGEELWFGTCFISCDIASEGKFPARLDDCTCALTRPSARAPGDYETNCVKFDKAGNGNKTHAPFLTDCPYEDEELYDGLCYTKCTELTYGEYPIRTGMNTCSNGKYGGDWTMGFGVCSGFAIGHEACLPNIPKASGAGFPGPAAEKGEAPMGFMTPPLPNRVKEVLTDHHHPPAP